MGFIEGIKAKAKANLQTIVLPETKDLRTYQAAAEVLKEGTAKIVLIGSPQEIAKESQGIDLTGMTCVDPATSDKTAGYIQKLVELRKNKGMTEEQAKELLLANYLYFGVMMVKCGDADGMVAGASHSTADVLRPSLQILKTKPGVKLVSSFFIMVVPDCTLGDNGTFLFTDCGLEQNPDAQRLASIAVSAAASYEAIVGGEARVAMLSHSSKGSAKHPDVDKVIEATKIAKELAPDVAIDGELQLDAAIVESVGASKAPGSEVAGRANVLVFPDLDSGNIGYKLVERLAKAQAYGPITQGIAAPVNDLSRGCSVKDIVGVVAITAVQAESMR